MRRVVLASSLLLVLMATNAFGQVRPPGRKTPKREFDLGVAWAGRMSFGSTSADLTTGSGSTMPLFSTSNERAAGVAVEGRLALQLTRRLQAEASGSWLRADLRSSVSADFEGADAVTATTSASSFSLIGSGVWSLRPRKPLEPFVRAGAGWIRDVTEGNVLVDDGTVVTIGAGVKYWCRQGAGLRLEVRGAIRSGGLELAADSWRVSPEVAGSVAFRF